MLELDHVTKDYVGPGETVHAVRDVSLSVEPGQFVVLLGPSGSGKSTLLLLAAGILHPESGCVRFDGQDVSHMKDNAAAIYRRRHLGFVFQHFNLMPGSAVDNVALPLRLESVRPPEARERAREMLGTVGLEKRAEHTADQLSGGERQRVAIARALAGSPRVVLADEPTGNLDSERGAQILKMLHDLCRERDIGVLMVTHDSRAIDFADRAYQMKDGQLSPINGSATEHTGMRS
ncbi:MAG: ABC transporter ATP-binding protein [Actinobacteria bacterium]|nr:ABC transporter ATP-binding protein [Actinomycetota bacterium]